MTRAFLLRAVSAVIAAAMAGCGSEPDYPADWPALQPPPLDVQGTRCPSLSGEYILPAVIKARVRKEPARLVYPHRFLTALAGRAPSGANASTPPPTRMRLDGPSADGLIVTFFDRRDRLISTHHLAAGVDYVCRGSWIADPAPSRKRAEPNQMYGRDVDGRLIGHTEYSGAGLVFILGVIPLPTYADDASWWRLEPGRPGGP